MNTRDAILNRIRTALAGEPDSSLPTVPPVWPSAPCPPPDELARQFFDELGRVQGEGCRFRTVAELQQRVAQIAGDSPVLGVADHPLCRAAVASVPPGQVAWVQPDWDRDRIASLPVGLLPAEFLLADTGSAVVVARSPAERLLCYLPTIAVVVAETHRLAAHMPDIWEQVTRIVADPAMRGEVVFVTGPSRTADIEKKLVLGAHGPKRLVVLITDSL